MSKYSLNLNKNQEDYVKDLEFLSESSLFLLKNPSKEKLFQFIADKIHDLSQALIFVSEYDDSINSTIVRSAKINKIIENIIGTILGTKIIGLTLAFDENTRKNFFAGRLYQLKGGIHELSFYKIPLPLSRLIEHTLKIGNIYAMAFVVEKNFLGTVAIITLKKTEIRNKHLIEAFINQSAVALKRLQTEKQLIDTKKMLEQETKHLKALEQKKDEFISIASHELKTPLTSVKGYAQILEKQLKQDNNPHHTNSLTYINNLNRELIKIEKLISDMLDVSKIEQRKLVLTKAEIDLDSLVRNTVSNYQLITTSHKMLITGNVKHKILGDENRLQQVLVNLLSNSVKYSPKSKKVIIDLKENKNEVVVTVEDFGIGIPRGKEEKIFDRYYRVNESIKQGFGLGLYISSEIISRHNGKIWVESKIGKGSKFFFSLPIKN